MNEKAKGLYYGLPLGVNGLIAIILGCIGMIYQAITPVSGFAMSLNSGYERIVKSMETACDNLKFLTAFGIVFVGVGIVLLCVKPKMQNSVLHKVLWFVPLGIIVVFALINFIPILKYINYWKQGTLLDLIDMLFGDDVVNRCKERLEKFGGA